MKINAIKINSEDMLKAAILINESEYKNFETKEKEGTRVEVVLPNSEFEKVLIKIPGKYFEENELEKNKPIYFENCELKLRQDFKTNEIICYGEASNIYQKNKKEGITVPTKN